MTSRKTIQRGLACALLLPAVHLLATAQIPLHSPARDQALLNEVVDISGDFRSFTNTYYCADSLADFDPQTGKGNLVYRRYEYSTRQAFDNMLGGLVPVPANEFPGEEYAESPSLPFALELISPRTVRVRAHSRFQVRPEQASLMLVDGHVGQDRSSWRHEPIGNGHRFASPYGSVTLTEKPWRIEFRDAEGRLLTSSVHMEDDSETFTPLLPFSFVRRASDYSTSFNAAFRLSPGERIFGGGEGFTEFNKRGQKVVLYTDDANGTQNETLYKPIPFVLSSRGYGMFLHTSSPITLDIGKYYSGIHSMMIGDDELDLFVFLGDPKDVLDEYTDLTGKSPLPPLWSFGLWMSRITYFSEEEGREVAAKLREQRVPSDVIHFDTGWFETDWRNDYQFSKSRFTDAGQMIRDLRDAGFRISLWQLPYFVPRNLLFDEIIEKGLYVRDRKGNLPSEDAVLDFSNPAAVTWYQEKLGGLLRLGVGAIKVDFGEAAPSDGLYHSGRTGFYEHNLYPLRYNQAAADITRQISGENIIWARSTWAGSQRYPVHWGGDAANTDSAMAATLRAGLSLGLSGFSFWSHDIGGFVKRTPEGLYRRWTPFGMLTSHTRTHGAPPKEPWEYGEDFLATFRKATEMKYRLMPYVYAQAKDCSERGLPMLRALFVEFPDDPGSWLIDHEYLFGSQILVAPLFEEADSRDVYLPPGQWIDYQTGTSYPGGWHHIAVGPIPIVILVRAGSVIPHIELAQSTAFLDWSKLELMVYGYAGEAASGQVFLPGSGQLQRIELTRTGGDYRLVEDPFQGSIQWEIRPVEAP